MGLYNPFIDEFTLHDAGFLLCDHAPIGRWNPKSEVYDYKLGIIRERARMTKNELVRYARNGLLQVFDNKGCQIKFGKDKLSIHEKNRRNGRFDSGLVIENCFVSRSSLEEWASEKNIKPVFLFPAEPKSGVDNLFDSYKHIDAYTLIEAGFLLCNHDPLEAWSLKQGEDLYKEVRGNAKLMADQLERNARLGELLVFDKLGNSIKFSKDHDSEILSEEERQKKYIAVNEGRRFITYKLCNEWLIMRDDLINFANGKNSKPLFLFQEVNDSSRNTTITPAHEGNKNFIRTRKNNSWFFLDQAAEWLSSKTNTEWNAEMVIDFSINQCKPDDIIEDKQYPTYLRAIQPVTQKIYKSDTGIIYNIEEYESVISGLVYVGHELKETAKLFKYNLEQIVETGKTKVSYTFLSDDAAIEYQKLAAEKNRLEDSIFTVSQPVTDHFKQMGFGSLQEAFPYIVYAGIPYTLVVDISAVGIRKKELKKLLRQYLELADADTSSQQKQVLVSPENKQDKPKAENAGIDKFDYLNFKKRIHPLDGLIEKAITEAGCDSTNKVFLKLTALAEQEIPPEPLTGGCGPNHIEYEKNNGDKEDFTKQALGKRLKRRQRRALEEIEQKNGHHMDG